MIDQLTGCTPSFGHLDLQEKREYLHVLSDVVWDIEVELAQARAEKAALMTSLQEDLRRELDDVGPAPAPRRPQSRALVGARW
jgi:hypothetical protein